MKHFLTILLSFFITLPLFAVEDICSKNLETIPSLAGGRVKPLYVLAQETLQFITPEKKPFDKSKIEVFCLLSLQAHGKNTELDLPIRIEHIEARKILGIDEDKTSLIASEVLAKETEIRMSYFAQKENNSLKKELNKILLRIQYYNDLTEGKTWTLAIEDTSKEKGYRYAPISEVSFEKLPSLIQGQRSFIKDKVQDNYMLEYYYFKLHPFGWSLLFILLAIFSIVIFKKNTIGFTFTGISITIQIIAMVVRILISGRAPITNMYETVMFSGFGALIISVILTWKKKDKVFLIGGLSYNMLCLFMMMFAHGMLDASIKPLVPVLRDNFWLSTHVTCVILSYAALALSWILANIHLLKQILGKTISQEESKRQVKIIYSAIQIGIVLLSAGVILGGVWADYSWGRFWGWDPKETWSLIVLLIYMAILHGKYSNWINDRNFIPLVAGAFLSVMMAWFGVNYILASGLHSYGFSEGGAIFLGSFFIVQIVILALAYTRTVLKKV